ncbi:fatty acid desaturase family protein [Acinetobacter nematophilus]|uniref:Fatty acid desaturase family protein n=1 Tax=Acinetobacter nematophilus TaxID=2994642 RepID=A0A9X3IHR2_9GAMM|nr:fatty acid desaturase family protein [Acinetobacter nematophilus]MCX5468100.1 fatty acid desaturase family protein [Acinetobacter nematophilus]
MTPNQQAQNVSQKQTRISDFLNRDEITFFATRSNWWGLWCIFSVWLVIALTFTVMALAVDYLPWYWAIPVVMGGMVILGGRHLALAIVMHEAAHYTLFKDRWMNDVFANWTSAKFIWNDVRKFRAHHMVHHAHTTASFDPDRPIYEALPVTRKSLIRKFARDFIGLTGMKFFIGRMLMSAGVLKWSDAMGERADTSHWPWHRYLTNFFRDFWATFLVNLMLYQILAATGHGWLFLMWILAYAIPFTIFVRIRAMAEHACLELVSDTLRNTRTTSAGWLARMTVAPVRVNYHMEHHLMASVPYYRLPRLHKLLLQRGHIPQPPSYIDVVRICSSLSAQTK